MKTIISTLLVACLLALGTGVANASSTGKSGGGGLPTEIGSSGVKTFIFSPRAHAWGVYDAEGKRVASGVANGGAHYCRDIRRGCHTPQGTFTINAKRGANCKSSKFPVGKGGAKMPYCSFFRGGYAIHGYAHLTNSNVSHGCIRVSTKNAAWIQSYLPIGSRVIVKSY